MRGWGILWIGLLVGCGGPVTAVFEGPLFVPDEVDTLVIELAGTGGSDPVRVRQEFALDGVRRPLSESLELVQGDALDDDVEIAVIALLGRARVASGAVIYDLDDAGVVTVPLSRWAEGGCDDPDGDERGDGPTCLDFDCDQANADVHPSAAEVCNDLDDDCDFAIDEGCPCDDGDFRDCGSDEGVCSGEIQVCAAGVWGDCGSAGHLRRSELCDGRDNDCDGTRDEGCL